jgi:hypothetical protein
MRRRMLQQMNAGSEPGELLLDTYTDFAAYWSLQKVKSDVVHVARVIRLNDNAEQDFTADEITDGTLEAWVGSGANNGRYHTIYDQTGNGRHYVRVGDGAIAVNNGELIRKNGKPAIYSDGTGPMRMICPINPFPVTGDITFSTFAVLENENGVNICLYGISPATGATDRRNILLLDKASATTRSVRLAGGNTVYTANESGIIQVTAIYTGGGGAIPAWINGNSKTVSSFSNTGLNIQTDSGFVLFNATSSGTHTYNAIGANEGYMQEWGWAFNDKTTQRAAIETNILNRWTVS